jgi:hypothetical protein
MANYLRSLGVKKGDAVSIYMPMVCDLPIAMLACARIGAVHSVVFGGFSAEALAGARRAAAGCTGLSAAAGVQQVLRAPALRPSLAPTNTSSNSATARSLSPPKKGRIADCKAKILITSSGVMRGNKKIDLKGIADRAVELAAKEGHNVSGGARGRGAAAPVGRRRSRAGAAPRRGPRAAHQGKRLHFPISPTPRAHPGLRTHPSNNPSKPPPPPAQVETVIVNEVKHAVPRKDTKFYENRDVWWEDAVKDMPKEAEVEWVEADHPLFLLYTSGSTGACGGAGVVGASGGSLGRVGRGRRLAAGAAEDAEQARARPRPSWRLRAHPLAPRTFLPPQASPRVSSTARAAIWCTPTPPASTSSTWSPATSTGGRQLMRRGGVERGGGPPAFRCWATLGVASAPLAGEAQRSSGGGTGARCGLLKASPPSSRAFPHPPSHPASPPHTPRQVHRRLRLDHGPLLPHLRPPAGGREPDRVRGRAHLPGR